jgi:hypothetical protein
VVKIDIKVKSNIIVKIVEKDYCIEAGVENR